MDELKRGDIVRYKGEDSHYFGIVVAVFKKLDTTKTRCIVENLSGTCLIKGSHNAKLIYSAPRELRDDDVQLLLDLRQRLLLVHEQFVAELRQAEAKLQALARSGLGVNRRD